MAPACPSRKTSSLFSSPAERLDTLVKALTAYKEADRKGELLQKVLDTFGTKIIDAEHPLLLAKGIIALNKGGHSEPEERYAQLVNRLDAAPLAELQPIVEALELLGSANVILISEALNALLASKHPMALARIFRTVKEAGGFFIELKMNKYIWDRDRATADQLEMLACALEVLHEKKNSDAEFQCFINAVCASKNPAILADAIAILHKNIHRLTTNSLASL